MTAVAMIGAYAGRWNLETTFQEVRCFLGLERNGTDAIP
jgi:hypothetical protein